MPQAVDRSAAPPESSRDTEAFNLALRARLRSLRQTLGFSFSDVFRRTERQTELHPAGIQRGRLVNIESGAAPNVYLDELYALAHAYDVSLREAVEGVPVEAKTGGRSRRLPKLEACPRCGAAVAGEDECGRCRLWLPLWREHLRELQRGAWELSKGVLVRTGRPALPLPPFAAVDAHVRTSLRADRGDRSRLSVASEASVSPPSTIVRWESGEYRRMDVIRLHRLSLVIGVPLARWMSPEVPRA